jgi:predicted acylesterase/phospholipase RssA
MSSNPKLNIALAFSGGGYRAAGFNLGVLTYLDRIMIDNTSLLQHVSILSTVSGGTITGSRYAIGIKKGESLHEIYNSIYSFMKDIDLITLGLERLISDKGWNEQRIKNLINAFADVYDEYLFSGEKFGRLQSQENSTHLRHISFNATDFAYALQFRFQWSDKTFRALQNETERGIIGNYYLRIPEEAAGEIRMGDIMAASSCFPGGFEPINFPTDFILPENIRNELQNSSEKYPVGLMDGGIVDNQGIEPILLAEERMNKKLKSSDSEKSKAEHALDLIIVSDVASPYMDKYKASEQKKNNWWRRLTPSIISSVLITLFLLSGFFLFHGINHVKDIYIVILMFIISICLIAFYI